jgi:hypothetical protein
MDIYSNLFESMISCCDRIGFRHGLICTVAMTTLGLSFCLNLLILTNLLWLLGVLQDPYRSGGGVHPQHYVLAIVCIGFVTNTILARIKFSADRQFRGHVPEFQIRPLAVPRLSLIRTPAAVYCLGSTLLFAVTLMLDLLIRG